MKSDISLIPKIKILCLFNIINSFILFIEYLVFLYFFVNKELTKFEITDLLYMPSEKLLFIEDCKKYYSNTSTMNVLIRNIVFDSLSTKHADYMFTKVHCLRTLCQCSVNKTILKI